jgi:hypothetical protein
MILKHNDRIISRTGVRATLRRAGRNNDGAELFRLRFDAATSGATWTARELEAAGAKKLEKTVDNGSVI